MSQQSFFAELQRRNVHRAALFYGGAAWLLVQIATQVFPFFDVPNWTVRAVVIAVAVGFPFAMLFSWFFEWTPQGIKRESEIDRSQSITRQTGKTLDRWIIAVMAVAIVLLLIDKFLPNGDAGTGSDKSIAVLPFTNTSGDVGNEYFSDGLSEELISSLSRLNRLKVIGRTSSFQFKGKTENSRAIGEALGVIYLLEGSVRKSAERVRITVSLVKSADGANVWSETYDRELKDIFAVQSEIAGSVAEQLKVALLGGDASAASQPAPPAIKFEAYTAVLQGNFHFARRSADDFSRAIAYYEEAIRIDPRYALAYAQLSVARTLLVTSLGDSNQLFTEFLDKARVEASTALRLDPGLAEAHYAQALLFQNADLDFMKARAELKKALERSPQNPFMLLTLGLHQAVERQFDEAAESGRRAVTIDPLSSAARHYLARTYTDMGSYDQAEHELRKAIELQPQSGQNYMQLATLQVLRGKPDAALELATQETSPFWRTYAMAFSSFAAGDRAAADHWLDMLISTYGDHSASQVAVVYAARGEPDKMFEWLDRAVAERDPGVLYLRCDPFLGRYQSDPRHAALVARLGIGAAPAGP